jgi:hypothetical protein
MPEVSMGLVDGAMAVNRSPIDAVRRHMQFVLTGNQTCRTVMALQGTTHVFRRSFREKTSKLVSLAFGSQLKYPADVWQNFKKKTKKKTLDFVFACPDHMKNHCQVLHMHLAWTNLYAALCLLLWPGLCGSSMVWTMRLPMLASMIHLWASIRGKSFPVTNSLHAPGVGSPKECPNGIISRQFVRRTPHHVQRLSGVSAHQATGREEDE